MRILQVSGEFYDSCSGGVGSYIYYLTKELAKNNEVHILTSKRGDWKFNINNENFKIHIIDISEIPLYRMEIWGRRANFYLKNLNIKFDVILNHVPCSWSFGYYYTFNSPLINIIHSFGYVDSKIIQQYNKRNIKNSLKISSGNILISNKLLIQLVSIIKNKNYVVIPNGVEIKRYSFKSNYFPFPIEAKGKLIYTYVGRLSKTKGTDLLIEVINELNNERNDLYFALLGGGVKYKSYKNKVNNINNIFLPGYIQKNLEDYYVNSDIFILPSFYEGLPTVILEAMASGLPIITTDVSDMKNIIKKNGLVIPINDKNSMKDAILKLANMDKNKLKIMGDYSKEIIMKYDWGNIGLEINKYINNILKNVCVEKK